MEALQQSANLRFKITSPGDKTQPVKMFNKDFVKDWEETNIYQIATPQTFVNGGKRYNNITFLVSKNWAPQSYPGLLNEVYDKAKSLDGLELRFKTLAQAQQAIRFVFNDGKGVVTADTLSPKDFDPMLEESGLYVIKITDFKWHVGQYNWIEFDILPGEEVEFLFGSYVDLPTKE